MTPFFTKVSPSNSFSWLFPCRNAPPWIQTKTGMGNAGFSSGAQTFRYRQSSLHTKFSLWKNSFSQKEPGSKNCCHATAGY